MKIRPIIPDSLGYFQQVHEKKGDGSAGHQQRDPSQEQSPHSSQEETPIQVTDEKITEAIESFQTDSQAKNLGISVQGVGQGPGLRIMLKDQKGKVLRQISAEEFLKLRESVQTTAAARGKILDQKM